MHLLQMQQVGAHLISTHGQSSSLFCVRIACHLLLMFGALSVIDIDLALLLNIVSLLSKPHVVALHVVR